MKSNVRGWITLGMFGLGLVTQGTASMGGGPSIPSASAASTPSTFEQGRNAIQHKDYAAASRLLHEALESDPRNADALNLLAFSERKQGHLDEAFEYYAQALKIRPRFPEAREYLAEAHLQAALKELDTLRSYGPEGKEEAGEVVEGLQNAVKNAGN